MRYLASDGWRKISEDGSSLITSILFNILTGESVSVVTRDYDREWCNDAEASDWYDVAIDHDARRAYCRKNMIITDGSRVLVVKGRKIEPGYAGVVDRIRKVRDRYGRWVANYVVFTDGKETNIDNCILIAD